MLNWYCKKFNTLKINVKRIYKVKYIKRHINFSKTNSQALVWRLFYHQPKASNPHAVNSFEISQFLPSASKWLYYITFNWVISIIYNIIFNDLISCLCHRQKIWECYLHPFVPNCISYILWDLDGKSARQSR